MIEQVDLAEKAALAHVLLVEPLGTVDTGDAGGDLTAVERSI